MLKNDKGMMLLIVYFVICVLFIFVGVFAFKSIWDAKLTEQYKNRLLAFYCADSAIDKAVSKLPSNTTSSSSEFLVNDAGNIQGEYAYTISVLESGKRWKVETWGYVPNQASAKATRHLEAYISKKDLPENFWNNAIYTAGNVRVNGNTYDIKGDVRYAGTLMPDPLDTGLFSGSSHSDPDVSPLVKLDYTDLRNKAASQIKSDGSDNVYTAAEISSGNPPLPTTFWYTRGDDGVDNNGDGVVDDPGEWVPNVVYIETDLILNGNVGTIGGFLLVVGDVRTNPDADSNDTVINGNGMIDGCIYSTGQFRVNGGAGNLNVFGGVWSGSDGVRLNGNVTVEYNKPYMDAIRYIINPSSIVQAISWREI